MDDNHVHICCTGNIVGYKSIWLVSCQTGFVLDRCVVWDLEGFWPPQLQRVSSTQHGLRRSACSSIEHLYTCCMIQPYVCIYIYICIYINIYIYITRQFFVDMFHIHFGWQSPTTMGLGSAHAIRLMWSPWASPCLWRRSHQRPRFFRGETPAKDVVFCCFVFFPTCQARVIRFYVRCAAPPSSCSSSFLLPSSPDLICQPALDSQWASPDLICQLLIAMVLAGLQPARAWALWSSPDFNRRESERWGPRRTGSGEGLSAVAAGLQPASPDFNRREPERCGPRRTSSGQSLSAVGLAGLQRARFGAPWDSPDFNRTSTARNKVHIECQRECQIECQIECQKICQIECQKIFQIECQKIFQIECQIECQKICHIEC